MTTNDERRQQILADLDDQIDGLIHSWRMLRPGFGYTDPTRAKNLNATVEGCLIDVGMNAANRLDRIGLFT